MRHHTGDLAFRLRGFDHPSVEEHRAARQCERVDLFLVHDVERVLKFRMTELGWHRPGEPRANGLDVVVDALVAEHRQLFLHLG